MSSIRRPVSKTTFPGRNADGVPAGVGRTLTVPRNGGRRGKLVAPGQGRRADVVTRRGRSSIPHPWRDGIRSLLHQGSGFDMSMKQLQHEAFKGSQSLLHQGSGFDECRSEESQGHPHSLNPFFIRAVASTWISRRCSATTPSCLNPFFIRAVASTLPERCLPARCLRLNPFFIRAVASTAGHPGNASSFRRVSIPSSSGQWLRHWYGVSQLQA